MKDLNKVDNRDDWRCKHDSLSHPGTRKEAIEDLALYLRKWAHDNQLPLGTGLADVVTSLFVATAPSFGGPQRRLVAEAVTTTAWQIANMDRKQPWTDKEIWEMAENVNDILRGRC